jgi:ubiquinone/menaquinone biosynthesis C-methylase UbiE
MGFMPSITVNINVQETTYEAPTQWRLLGAEGKADHIIALCEKNKIVPKTVLEVGAGDGAILRCLSEKGFCKAMHAVEISQSGVQVILGQHISGLISCQTFNGYNLPFKDDSVELVILSHVLEHVEFERALLREARRVSEYQVIEIPMDFSALENDNFHLLGPSYGHINAHSPSSLRFLLSTEDFKVLDGLLGQYTLALQEYDYFVNNSHEKTPAALTTFRASFEQEKKGFDSLSTAQQERRASFYAVLARKENAQERIAKAISAAKSYISSGQVQASKLIFKQYIPKPKEIDASLEIARFCLQGGHWPAAMEYVERVLKVEESNSQAVEIKTALQGARQRQMKTLSSSRSLLKQKLKANFPFLVSLARKLPKKYQDRLRCL